MATVFAVAKQKKLYFKRGDMWLDNTFWDSSSFRPDIQILDNNKKHDVIVIYDKENLIDGKLVSYPKEIYISTEKFTNIR